MSADALSKMAGQTGAAAVAAALKRASAATGSSFELLYNMARRESSLDPTAKASTSSAAGLFQFIEQTWLGAVKSYGGKHGLAEAAAAIEQGADGRFKVSDATRRAGILDLRYNAEHAAALAGELVQENRASLQKRLGRDPSSAELYAAHFLGAAGAAKLLEAPSETSAATLLPNAAAANKPVFYANGRARTVAEVMASIERSMGSAGVLAAPEQKSATFVSFPSAEAVVAPSLRWGADLAPALHAPEAPSAPDVAGLARLFGLRAPEKSAGLSPLALAVLQALDPARLLKGDTAR
ncbi:MAG: transglycosylase SLT domain-containing protein [Parvularculaceae bacterium]